MKNNDTMRNFRKGEEKTVTLKAYRKGIKTGYLDRIGNYHGFGLATIPEA